MLRNCWCWATLLLISILGTAIAAEAPDLELRLDSSLSELSMERLADGSAAAQPAPQPAPSPVVLQPAVTSWYSYTPALVFGALLLTLLAFSLGLLTARRRLLSAGQAAAPVQLWNDSDTLESEIENLRGQLQEQQLLNESLQSAHDSQNEQLDDLRRERDQAAGESQVLRMRQDDDELAEAHELIDQLRAELEQLRGADADLDHDPHALPASDDVAELRGELEQRNHHIHELEELMVAVRGERDTLQQQLGEHQAQLDSFAQTLEQRDTELEQLQQQLLQHQQSQQQLQELQQQLEQQGDTQQQVAELQQQLAISSEQASAAQRQSDAQQQEIEDLQDQLNLRHDAEDIVSELKDRKEQLENELKARREELILLAEQNDRLQARLYELEQVVRKDEDLTTQMELGGQPGGVSQDLPAAQAALRDAQEQVQQLQNRLQQLQQQQAEVPEDTADIQRQNVKLSAMIIQRDNMVEELKSQLAAAANPDNSEQWTSTVSSLENEVRRKAQLVDSHRDDLQKRDNQIADLQQRLSALNEQLERNEDEKAALESGLNETRALAAGLRQQLDTQQHQQTRQNLAENPEQDPFSQHVDAIDPVAADIETLRFTVRSREDLVASLAAILDEESKALQTARQRASGREDQVVALENEIAANRITIAALQNRVSQARENGAAPDNPLPQTLRLERELQRSVKVNEKLRADLHLWQRRVKPLHEAVVMREARINNLTREIEALRQSRQRGIARHGGTGEYDLTMELGTEQEREHCLREIARLWEEIEQLESRLAETGVELSRTLALDDTCVKDIENLEAARAAQVMRIDELHHELMTLGSSLPQVAEDDNIVDLQAHRPSS